MVLSLLFIYNYSYTSGCPRISAMMHLHERLVIFVAYHHLQLHMKDKRDGVRVRYSISTSSTLIVLAAWFLQLLLKLKVS